MYDDGFYDFDNTALRSLYIAVDNVITKIGDGHLLPSDVRFIRNGLTK